MRHFPGLVTSLVLASAMLGSTVDAQPRGSSNYSQGRGGGQTNLFQSPEAIPNHDELEAAILAAPWKLGILRLQPWIGIRDARMVTDEGFVAESSSGGEPGDGDSSATSGEGGTDFTVSAGAGLRSYVKMGENAVLAAHALPEYVWWADDDDRSQLNGRFGVGIFQHLNRFQLEISARREERQGLFSSEDLQLVSALTDTARVATSFRFGNRTRWVTSYSRVTNEVDDEDRVLDERFRRADRETDTLRSTLEWDGPGGWTVSLGGEASEIRSTNEVRDLSADATSILAGLGYSGNRFDASFGAQRRDLEPAGDSALLASEATTGSFDLGFRFTKRDQLRAYASRELQLSTSLDFGQITSDRVGLSYRRSFPRWSRNEVNLDLYAETGEEELTPSAGSVAAARVDDVTAWGAWLSLRIRKSTTFWLGGGSLEIDSDLDEEDRTYTSLGLSLQLNFNFGLRNRNLVGSDRSSGRW